MTVVGHPYQHDPEMAPDSAFEPGRLAHLVVGNEGRLLDARRTPVRVVGLRPELAFFEVEVLAFEDRGARWELPIDDVDRFQFAHDSTQADAATVAQYEDVNRRFDSMVEIPIVEDRRADTMVRLAREREAAAVWFEEHSVWARTDRSLPLRALTGDPRLFEDLATFFASRGLTTIETAFTGRYVSNPSAGEEVKGHAVVAAELGLAAYRGPAIRDPASFDGDWSRERRAEHLLARLAFVSALFTVAGRPVVELYRGLSFDGPVNWRPAGTFVSATFHRPIAEAQAELGPNRSAGVLFIQRVQVERLLMTYFETTAMNTPFQEAEAVVLAWPTALF
jgi:hypothetical protein